MIQAFDERLHLIELQNIIVVDGEIFSRYFFLDIYFIGDEEESPEKDREIMKATLTLLAFRFFFLIFF